jgi:4-amino-4-deoxy-L-arabinose transferase-like glycosyltransferase/membrane-associated phospholipid phosphatase
VSWLTSIDIAAFRFINGAMANPFFDWLMPIFAGNAWFWPALIVCGITTIWRGGVRGRLCVLMLAIVIPVGDGWISNTLKYAVARPRPCLALNEVNLPMRQHHALDADSEYRRGCSPSGSFPSGHTTNWFAATMVLAMYFRRVWKWTLPMAVLVGFSRIYNGVHYPGDVLGGAIVGAGYAAVLVWSVDALWRALGKKWFPAWHQRLPSLLPVRTPTVNPVRLPAQPTPDFHWLRLGCIVIAVVLLGRLVLLALGDLELSEDEAYQWLWSKHLALSYFSKPPLIAYVQWLGTTLFGDSEFGVRFFSPVCAAIGSCVMLLFFARHVNARAGFWLVVAINVTPLLAVGSTVMTVDPLLVFFWTLAMVSGWRAVQRDGTTWQWALVGLWMGVGFLSKYSALMQWISWAVFFALWKPSRAHLKRLGPYVALFVNALLAVPVIMWNAQNHWITAAHVANDAKLDVPWRFQISNVIEFLTGTAALMHPIFFIAVLWAAIAFWRCQASIPNRTALLRYFFAMGAPVFLIYFGYTIHSSVQINWIAVAVIPLFALAAIFWDERDRAGARGIRTWLAVAVGIGVFALAIMHDSEPFIRSLNKMLVQFDAGPLPGKADPLRRVRGWTHMSRTVGREYRKFAAEGPAFIIAGHYGTTSLLSFYMPEAKTAVTDTPLVYYRFMPKPRNQFYFWPTYRETRRGQNALYIQQKDRPEPPPKDIVKSFQSVSEIGSFPVMYRGRVLHHVQIFTCRELR